MAARSSTQGLMIATNINDCDVVVMVIQFKTSLMNTLADSVHLFRGKNQDHERKMGSRIIKITTYGFTIMSN